MNINVIIIGIGLAYMGCVVSDIAIKDTDTIKQPKPANELSLTQKKKVVPFNCKNGVCALNKKNKSTNCGKKNCCWQWAYSKSKKALPHIAGRIKVAQWILEKHKQRRAIARKKRHSAK